MGNLAVKKNLQSDFNIVINEFNFLGIEVAEP